METFGNAPTHSIHIIPYCLFDCLWAIKHTRVNGDLTDECLVSFVQLEEAFIKDKTSKGFNPFGSGEDIADADVLIDMVSMCSQNGFVCLALKTCLI